MGFWWVIKLGWQRIFLTDLTDVAADFEADVADGFLVGDKIRLATDFFNGFNGWFLGGAINN